LSLGTFMVKRLIPANEEGRGHDTNNGHDKDALLHGMSDRIDDILSVCTVRQRCPNSKVRDRYQ